MSMRSISQSAMLTDAVYAARRSSVSFQSQSSRFASERVCSERAMCTMHMADKSMYAAMAMSMAAAASASTLIIRTDVHTSVSLFAVLSLAFIALVVVLVVSLLLVSLVVLISLITLLLTCLTGQKTLESLVGQAKRTVKLASTRRYSIQGA